MIEYQCLLCPVDFSEISGRALKVASDLAEKFAASLHVLHVFQYPASSFPEGIYTVSEDEGREIRSRLSRKLDKFVSDNTASEIEITTGLSEGIPHIEIVRSAEKNNADMIVMGTHGRTGLSHVLLGSVAERVIHTSTIPVLSVRK